MQPTTVHLRPGDDHYAQFVAGLGQEPLCTQWWNDAESEHEPGVSYVVACAPSRSGPLIAAAWAGYVVRHGILRCCNNYVVHGFRGQDYPHDLYARAYRVRHRDVVVKLDLPAETYLYPEPVELHLADGWQLDTTPGGSGVSRAHEHGGEHQWQRLTWAP